MSKIVLVTTFVFALCGSAVAQLSVDVDFGIRGGAFNSGTPIEVPNNQYFPERYSDEKLPFTFGAAVGVLFNDHWEARFEVVRSRFRIHDQSGTPFPTSGYRYTSTTDGHVWQYPLLLTYLTGKGTVRPFGGGGISFASAFRGTTRAQTTRVVGPIPANPNLPFDTITTTSTQSFKLYSNMNPMALYITGGVDGRVSFLSIRPEFRYGHWVNWDMRRSNINAQHDTVLFSPNQPEFLIGISVRPLRFKSRQSQ